MVKKLEITIPTTLMDVSVSQYQRFLKETKDVTDESIIQEKVLTIFCGITLQQLRALKANQVEDIMSRVRIHSKSRRGYKLWREQGYNNNYVSRSRRNT